MEVDVPDNVDVPVPVLDSDALRVPVALVELEPVVVVVAEPEALCVCDAVSDPEIENVTLDVLVEVVLPELLGVVVLDEVPVDVLVPEADEVAVDEDVPLAELDVSSVTSCVKMDVSSVTMKRLVIVFRGASTATIFAIVHFTGRSSEVVAFQDW